jgi:hypothetical protein
MAKKPKPNPERLQKLETLHSEVMKGMAGLIAHLSKPKTVTRGPDGRLTGVQ